MNIYKYTIHIIINNKEPNYLSKLWYVDLIHLYRVSQKYVILNLFIYCNFNTEYLSPF